MINLKPLSFQPYIINSILLTKNQIYSHRITQVLEKENDTAWIMTWIMEWQWHQSHHHLPMTL